MDLITAAFEEDERQEELEIRCALCDYLLTIPKYYMPGEEWREYFCSEECRDMYELLYAECQTQ